MSCLFFSSCSDDDADIVGGSSQHISGHWIGEYTYYNPVGGMKSQFLYVDFNEDGSGKLEYTGPVNYAVSYFSYSVSGSTIRCVGAHGNMAEGSVTTDFEMSLRIEGDRLIPLDKYSNFILTRDGSVVTTEGGSEVVDKSNLLRGVWIMDDKTSLVEFKADNSYTEYVLDPPGSKTYSSVTTGSYEYNAVKNWLTINGARFQIAQLYEQRMALEAPSGVILYYNKGAQTDVPVQNNIVGTLVSGHTWCTRNAANVFVFNASGDVIYMENGPKVGSLGTVVLVARGTFSIAGSKMTCRFYDVSWDASSSYPNIFPGWTAGKSVTKTYTIEMSLNCFIVTDPAGKKMYMYAD